MGVAPVVGYPYADYPYAAPAVVPATQSITYKTYTPTWETNVVATNAAVPVAVGGYKAVAGDNGELKGAVHEVPAIFGAPALNAQVNDAEPKADPYLLYGGYYGHGLGYGYGYGYPYGAGYAYYG